MINKAVLMLLAVFSFSISASAVIQISSEFSASTGNLYDAVKANYTESRGFYYRASNYDPDTHALSKDFDAEKEIAECLTKFAIEKKYNIAAGYVLAFEFHCQEIIEITRTLDNTLVERRGVLGQANFLK